MFRPSAAPRWNNTTKRFFPVPATVDPYTARVRKLGTAAVPTKAIAPPFRNALRVIAISDSYLGQNPFALSEVAGVICAGTQETREAALRSSGGLLLALMEHYFVPQPADRLADSGWCCASASKHRHRATPSRNSPALRRDRSEVDCRSLLTTDSIAPREACLLRAPDQSSSGSAGP